jgi:hypothetical protein
VVEAPGVGMVEALIGEVLSANAAFHAPASILTLLQTPANTRTCACVHSQTGAYITVAACGLTLAGAGEAAGVKVVANNIVQWWTNVSASGAFNVDATSARLGVGVRRMGRGLCPGVDTLIVARHVALCLTLALCRL